MLPGRWEAVSYRIDTTLESLVGLEARRVPGLLTGLPAGQSHHSLACSHPVWPVAFIFGLLSRRGEKFSLQPSRQTGGI